MLRISTREQFEEWLAEHDFFEYARVLAISPGSGSSILESPFEVTIEIACIISGDWRAHSQRVSRVFLITAGDIAVYHLDANVGISSEHWSEGIEVIESEYPIALVMDLPTKLTLCCNEITVEELPNHIDTFKPWLTDREVFAEYQVTSMLTPLQWETKFKEYGQDVVWHVYGGSPRRTVDVPISNYEGWFLQCQRDLKDGRQGIFFFHCRQVTGGFFVSIKNDGASKSLWQALLNILASFIDVKIKCGNCEFTGDEFLIEWKKWSEIYLS